MFANQLRYDILLKLFKKITQKRLTFGFISISINDTSWRKRKLVLVSQLANPFLFFFEIAWETV